MHHGSDYFRQKVGGNCRDNAYFKLSGYILLFIADDLFDLEAFLQYLTGLLNDAAPNFSRYNRLLAAVEDLYIQHFFQFLDLHA
ncbi:hypothetical protein D3C86_1803170 [compost metagenome]